MRVAGSNPVVRSVSSARVGLDPGERGTGTPAGPKAARSGSGRQPGGRRQRTPGRPGGATRKDARAQGRGAGGLWEGVSEVGVTGVAGLGAGPPYPVPDIPETVASTDTTWPSLMQVRVCPVVVQIVGGVTLAAAFRNHS